MPQADLVSFGPTLLLLPAAFLVGYFFFTAWWVPRILTTLKARHWLLHVRHSSFAVGLIPVQGWSELFLLFVQFVGLLWFLSRLTFVTSSQPLLRPLVRPVFFPVTYELVGGLPVENFFHLWSTHRDNLFYPAAAAGLTTVFQAALTQFVSSRGHKQFPLLRLKLKHQLFRAADLVG